MSYLSRLNPAERRFVVGVGLLFFVVINLVWVRLYFSDWGKLKTRSAAAYVKLQTYQDAIKKIPETEKKIKELESENAYVPPEDQSIQFLRTIQVQASQSGVGFNSSGRQTTSTNLFFLEQSQTVSIVSGEKQMVDFLFNLGSGNSLIRVREISVRPDPNRQQLNANLTLVASYQKKRATPAATPAVKPAATPATKPPGTPAAKPGQPAGSKPTVPPPPGSKPAPPKPATPNKK